MTTPFTIVPGFMSIADGVAWRLGSKPNQHLDSVHEC
jgi:hypothetical protein